jgi:predicted GH43/DUF377 family glycosyl hydrolase
MNSDTTFALLRLAQPVLEADYGRLVLRHFIPRKERILHVVARVAALSEEVIQEELRQVTGEFSDDHADLPDRFEEHFNRAWDRVLSGNPKYHLSPEGRRLVGAYFSSEYAFEATALFNPSIVPAPDREQKNDGSLRFIMSARSVGEGHVSSISFWSGLVDQGGNVFLDPSGRTAVTGRQAEQDGIQEVQFDDGTCLSERLLFPFSRSERNGMEDARFVRFTDDDGAAHYYATYTAYDGRNIRPRMLKTEDFLTFKMINLYGDMVRNKGMALFPRKIRRPEGKRSSDLRYAMLSRIDGESIYLMLSENLHTWNEGVKIASPRFPWEFMQMGNCGSPLELPEGWLVLTHGVGSLRRYSIGALLLDKEDPSKIIGRLSQPLISPGERERAGYVPNVVYTCGYIIHQNRLIIPYGSADQSIAVITVGLGELLDVMR